jgi:NAD(P)-dependent dehydrogenase (short-subunit alcohol dehydrogenase family)
MELQNKRIIVTGCASGMGAATVRSYANAGAQVVGMDIVDDAGRAVCADAAANAGSDVTYVSIDVADSDSVTAAFAEASEHLGGLDALAHPAAIHAVSTPDDVTVAAWDHMFAVNVRGTMLTNQAAYELLKVSGGGAIINFGSMSAQRPEPGAAAYSAAKGAIHSWTRTASGAWGADGVRVNAVLPAIKTPMFQTAWDNSSEDERTEKYWRNMQGIAMGQDYGDPDRDLGPVMVFLASDGSRFITGQLIPVDGGQGHVR